MYGPEYQSNTYTNSEQREGPIISCILQGTHREIEDGSFDIQVKRKLGVLEAENVNYSAFHTEWEDCEQKNGGENSYVISKPSSLNKCSERYENCTGIAVVGKNKKTRKNVSVLTHQDPVYFLKKNTTFKKDLLDTLRNIAEQCEECSLDTVIFGGNYSLLPSRWKLDTVTSAERYRASIQKLREIIGEAY